MAETAAAPVSADLKDSIEEAFRTCWMLSTDGNKLTVHGFRRFKTTHLLNLRLLEREIAKMDRTIHAVGRGLNLSPSSHDWQSSQHGEKNANVLAVYEAITPEFVTKLRNLIKQYDEALASFDNIMAMETFSLLDDEKHSSLRDDMTLYQKYDTRLLRADLGPRSRTDPFQR